MGQEDMRGVKGGPMRVSALKRRNYLLKLMYSGLINHCARNFPLQLNSKIMPKPDAVDIYQTFRCNLRCKHCDSYRRGTDELDTNQWEKIIIGLKKWLGNFRLRVSGGEPFVRSDLLHIVEFANRSGIATVITTNGTLIDGAVAEKIVKSGLDFISISLDGAKEGTHDFLRTAPGAYSKVIRAIELLKDKVAVQIYTTISNYNLDEILDLVSFAEKNRIRIFFQGLAPRAENKNPPSDYNNYELWPKDKGGVELIFQELIKRKKRSRSIMNSARQLRLIYSHYRYPERDMGYSCQTYKSNFMVMPDGGVQLCDKYGVIGNISGESPQAIWKSKKADLIRRDMKECRKNCSFIGGYYYDTLFEKISKLKSLFLP